jgi:hypothetical protein
MIVKLASPKVTESPEIASVGWIEPYSDHEKTRQSIMVTRPLDGADDCGAAGFGLG